MFKKITILFMLIFFFIISLNAVDYNVDKGNSRILILYYKSDYKVMLLDLLVKDLNSKKISVTADLMTNSKNYKSADYNAVLIMSGVKEKKPYKEAIDYIVANDYPSNLIYFNALGITKDAFNAKISWDKVDSITSASNKNNLDTTKNEIIQALLKKIK